MSEITKVDGVDTHPDWSQVPDHARHVFLCTGPRCTQRGALQLWKSLRRHLLAHDRIETPGGVLLTRTHCQFPCNLGPIVTVYPERCWYGVHNRQEVQRLVEVHLLGGEVVEDLLIRGAHEALVVRTGRPVLLIGGYG